MKKNEIENLKNKLENDLNILENLEEVVENLPLNCNFCKIDILEKIEKSILAKRNKLIYLLGEEVLKERRGK